MTKTLHKFIRDELHNKQHLLSSELYNYIGGHNLIITDYNVNQLRELLLLIRKMEIETNAHIKRHFLAYFLMHLFLYLD